MSAEIQDNTVTCSYSVHAVIFGVDESLLNIQLKDGFCLKKLSLIPHVSHLDKIFDTTDLGLRREYETARIDLDTLDVICAVKQIEYTEAIPLLENRFEQDIDEDLISLDNQIRVIRLLNEGPVRFKKIAFHQNWIQNIEGMGIPCNHNSIVPIGEAMKTNSISTFHCGAGEVASLNNAIITMSFPLSDNILNTCHTYYDLSYHTEMCVAVTLLTTALEMLFLKRNEKDKQKKLSKRCAVFIADNDYQKARTAYDNLKTLYDKRSDFVHEGKLLPITTGDIIELRGYVRDSLLKALSLSENKDQRITRLTQYISQHSTGGLRHSY